MGQKKERKKERRKRKKGRKKEEEKEEESTFESRKNTTVSAAILCPEVCINDVMNKAGMRGKSIIYVTASQALSALRW